MLSLLSSYRIPEEVMVAVMDGKKTNKTSYEDRPLGVDYLKLEVGNSTYFIYEESDKYYVEQPYVAIYRISEDVYEAALEYAVSPDDYDLNADTTNENKSKDSEVPHGKVLPDFKYSGDDIVEKLVYDAAASQDIGKMYLGDFAVFAAEIFGDYKEENKVKIFATIYTSSYSYDLEDKVVEEVGGGIVPVAITYTKNDDGTYTLEEYLESMDGSFGESSIKEFCTMPVSGKKISGLANKMINNYSSDKLIKIQRDNLIKHLEENNQKGVSLLVRGYDEPDMLIGLTR